ncbi:MAG TPA: hypothetical protein VH419_16440 [Nocardioidaceae bacterium]
MAESQSAILSRTKSKGSKLSSDTRSILTAALALPVLTSLSLSSPSAGLTSATAAPREPASHVRHVPVPAPVVHVHVTVKKHRIIASKSGFRPGNTVVDLSSEGGGIAAIQLLRLRSGYTFAEFQADVESDNIQALRRIDRDAIFYGGMPVYERRASHFGARLDAGRYFLIDFDHPRIGRLLIEGAPERRSLPRSTGSINMVLDHQQHRFQTPRRLPRSGWLRQTNHTDEPHFMDMIRIKSSTTRKQVRRFYSGQGPEDPSWVLHNYSGTFLISPGRSVVWRYAFPRGKYLEACYWPSREDGTTHAEMGMWNFTTLE